MDTVEKKSKFGFQNRTPEERKEFARKGVKARMKNAYEKLHLQRCMKTLLEMDVPEEQHREILKKFGYYGHEDQNNATLLMVALFRKGLSGDVSAIREITDMMDKLDVYHETKRVQQEVNIFIQPVGRQYVPNEKDEEEIRRAEQNETEEDDMEEDWGVDLEEAVEDWGTEVYEGNKGGCDEQEETKQGSW